LGEKCFDALVEFDIIVAGDDVRCVTFDGCFDDAVVFRIAADLDISRKQHVFATFLDEDQQFQDVGLGDAVFVLDPGADQHIGDLGDNRFGNNGEEIAVAKGLEYLCGETDGFRMAETQILVSRTALIATLLFPDFLHRVGDVRFYFFRSELRRARVDFPENVIKPLLPIVVGEDFQLDLFMLFEVHFLKRLENPVFEYCIDYFGHADLLCDGFPVFTPGSFAPSIADEVTTDV
jgi:hypothetical protein